jgi:hypothetical protein
MAEDVKTALVPSPFQRRGMLAGVAALVVAAATRLGERSARAATGSPVVQGQTNTADAQTTQVNSNGGVGFSGQSTTNSYGVYGTSVSGSGVVGSSTSGPGLQGFSTSQTGLTGSSQTTYGAFGSSQSGPGLGGFSVSGIGGFLQTQAVGQWAGIVNNTQAATQPGTALGLNVIGNLVVTDGTKSAAVRTSKGLTLLYSVEAPQSLFEDVGRAQLSNGQCRVALDATFLETIDTSNYHVFLTPLGDCRGLYVSTKRAQGFEVRELQGGTSSIEFDYRIVAARANLPPHRFKTLPEPELPKPVDARLLRHPGVGGAPNLP